MSFSSTCRWFAILPLSGTFALTAPLSAQQDMPAVQKVQLHFSLVSHFIQISDRVTFYNGTGAGNYTYAVPYLACDPTVTLYNPHPHPITVDHVRVRIWDPPVAFRFRKNDIPIRQEYADGEFLGLARFQISNQDSTVARKYFTLFLTTPSEDTGLPGQPISLQPGETRVFSPWVEAEWTWRFENPGGYTTRSFNDFSTSLNYTNVDGRTGNPMGVECIPGKDARAGFQWDHLSCTNHRPVGSAYLFERGSFYGTVGWVATQLADTFSVEARLQRTVGAPSEPDFRISVLAGNNPDAQQDILQDFSFNLQASETALSPVGGSYYCGSLLQSADEPTAGGKTLFATLTARAKLGSLTRGNLEVPGTTGGNDHYQLEFTGESDPVVAGASADKHLGETVAGTTILHSARIGDDFRLSLATPAGSGPWRVMGGPTLQALDTDLTSLSTIYPGPPGATGTEVRMVSIDTSTLGSRYFVRLEEITAASE